MLRLKLCSIPVYFKHTTRVSCVRWGLGFRFHSVTSLDREAFPAQTPVNRSEQHFTSYSSRSKQRNKGAKRSILHLVKNYISSEADEPLFPSSPVRSSATVSSTRLLCVRLSTKIGDLFEHGKGSPSSLSDALLTAIGEVEAPLEFDHQADLPEGDDHLLFFTAVLGSCLMQATRILYRERKNGIIKVSSANKNEKPKTEPSSLCVEPLEECLKMYDELLKQALLILPTATAPSVSLVQLGWLNQCCFAVVSLVPYSSTVTNEDMSCLSLFYKCSQERFSILAEHHSFTCASPETHGEGYSPGTHPIRKPYGSLKRLLAVGLTFTESHTVSPPHHPSSVMPVDGTWAAPLKEWLAKVHLLLLVHDWRAYVQDTEKRCAKWISPIERENHSKFLHLIVEQLERFTRCVSPPPPKQFGEAQQSNFCHRTIHTSLNLRLAELWDYRNEKRSGKDALNHHTMEGTPHAFSSHPSHAIEAFIETAALKWKIVIASELSQLFNTFSTVYFGALPTKSTSFGTSLVEAMNLFARTIRCGMELENRFIFEVYRYFRIAPFSSIDAVDDVIKFTSEQWSRLVGYQPAVGEATEVTYNVALIKTCIALRSQTVKVVHGAVSCFSTQKRSSHVPLGDFIQKNFLKLFEKSFHAILRRHFMFNGQECWIVKRFHSLFNDLQLNFVESCSKDVCRFWLLTYLRLRDLFRFSVNQVSHLNKAEKSRGYFTVCGVELSQALEVGFFFVLYLQRWPRLLSSGEAEEQEETMHMEILHYLQEVFLTLEHSTAKQLWHLRSGSRMFYFTGEDKNHRYLATPTLRHRHARSLVSVVHSHVIHTSLLWAPLSQVQEIVLILSRYRQLLYDDEESSSSDSPTLTTDEAKVEKDTLAWSDQNAELSSLEDALDTMPNVHGSARVLKNRAETVVGSKRSDLSLFHGYLMLRLYVMSNALRQFRLELRNVLERSNEGTETERRAVLDALGEKGMNRLAEALDQLAELEPESERNAPKHLKPWIKELASDLWKQQVDPTAPPLLQQVEWSGHWVWGAVKTFRRLERTIQLTVKNNLLFSFVGERKEKMRRQVLTHGSASSGATEDLLGSLSQATPQPTESHQAAGDGCCMLRLERPDPQNSLGFVLNGASASIIRVQERENSSNRLTPIAEAAHQNGLSLHTLTRYDVKKVDGFPVETAREVAQQLKGKISFTLTLERRK